MKETNVTAMTKAVLLSIASINISDNARKEIEIQRGNLYRKDWIFLRLNMKSRIRLLYDNKADLLLCHSPNGNYQILNTLTNTVIAENVQIETVLAHAPEQLFFALYKKCITGCKFCPLSIRTDDSHYSLDLIYSRIQRAKKAEIKSIGLTSSSPPNLSTSDIVDEYIFLISKIREKINPRIPIGVSLKTPSREDLCRLKKHGVDEVRLNLEVYNGKLSKKLMPLKSKNAIMKSIEYACDVFGSGQVSSNMLVGVGDSDEELIKGVEALAKIGAVATLYPYDPVEGIEGAFQRPSAERLYSLAIEQKNIFDKYKIDTNRLRTMCCSCSASHIFPGKDL
jgi:biotin synthase-related radical SAM superfamily protein